MDLAASMDPARTKNELRVEILELRERNRLLTDALRSCETALAEATKLLLKAHPARVPIGHARRQLVAGKQLFRCAGVDGDTSACPLWKLHGGMFTESGFECHHRVPYRSTYRNTPDELVAVCHHCHALAHVAQRAREEEEDQHATTRYAEGAPTATTLP